MFIKEGDEVSTQLNEGLIMELLPGFGKGALRNSPDRNVFGMGCFKEIIQLILEGTFNEIHEKKDYVVKR
jgi:hypothetical protein